MKSGAVLLLLALAVPSASWGAPEAVLPFAYDDTRLWAGVTLPGSPSVRSFVLDTGASHTLIDAEVARRAGLESKEAGETTGAGGGRTRLGRTGPVKLSVGGVPFAVESATTAPLETLLAASSGRHVDGIVGAQFFHEHVVEIDFERRQITLHDPGTFSYRGKGAVIPVRFDGGVPLAHGALTLPDGRRRSLEVVLDLGAKSTLLLAQPFLERTGLRSAFPRSVEAPLGAGMGGPTRYAFARARSVSLGLASTEILGPVVGLSVNGVLGSTWYDGLLGAGYLSRFRVILDYARSRVILEATPSAKAHDRFDASGLFLEADGPGLETVSIAEVRPGSPAATAGLKPQDRITKVDHLPIGRFTLGALRERLADGSGSIVPLEIVRDGHTRSLRLRLEATL